MVGLQGLGSSPGAPLARLESRGLSSREALSVDARHRRRHGAPISAELVEGTLRSLDTLQLLPGQAAHLLRTSRLDELRAECDRATDRPRRWCSYKKALCDCEARPPAEPAPPPRLLSVDCEFRPLRMAAVDEELRLRLDCMIPNEHVFPMMCVPPGSEHGSEPSSRTPPPSPRRARGHAR